MNSDFVLSVIEAMAVAAALGVGLAFTVWYLCRSVYAGLWLVLALFLVEAGAVSLPVISIGFSAYPSDVVFFLIGIAGVVRALSLPYYSYVLRIWVLFGAILMASFLLGITQFGTVAGVEFRHYFSFWFGTLYFATFSLTERQLTHIVYAWCTAACGVLLIALYRWFADFIGLDNSSWAGITGTTSLRVVQSAQALVLAQALSVLIYLRLRGQAVAWTAVLPWLAIGVLVLQHRTVWVVTLACLMAMFILERKSRGQLVGNLVATIVVALAILIPILVAGNYLDVVTQSLQASVSEAQAEKSTFVWRVQSWQELLKSWSGSGPQQYLFGSPFGTGFARYISGSANEVTLAPHSYYVQTLLRVGLVGIALLLATYWRALSTFYRAGDELGVFPRKAFILLLLAQLVYFITYGPGYAQGIILGTALSLIGREELAAKRRLSDVSAPPTLGASDVGSR